MSDSSPTSQPTTNTSLEDLPRLKADLEEARQLLSRLEARQDTTDPDRYERLRSRYQEKIEALGATVERLTDEGKTRRIELEDRQAYQRDRAENAGAELQQIEALHAEEAMAEADYRKERRQLRQQKREAEKAATSIAKELDEVEFYLTETGEVSYQTERLRGQGGRLRSLVWGGLGTLLLAGVLYGLLAGLGGTETSMFRGGTARIGVYDGPGPEAPVRAAWRFETEGRVESSPAVAGGTVYVGSFDNHLYAIDAETGEQQWRFETDSFVSSAPAVTGGTVYVGSQDGHLYAIDAETGEQQWRFETEGRVFSSPAVTGGTVYVGNFDNHLYAIDAETGEQQWQFETEDWVSSSPAVAGGTIYVGSLDGYLYALQ